MNFVNHSNLKGLHAPFSPSQPHWLKYSDEKAIEVLSNKRAAERGTRLHEWAAETIELGIKMPRTKQTLNMYVNDAIGFKMHTEQILFYSPRFFGTADAISFKNGLLRIHDLKTGKNEAKMTQLMVYVALFCLEYDVRPGEIDIELRLYQNDQVVVHKPTVEEIAPIMDQIVHLDELLERLEKEEG